MKPVTNQVIFEVTWIGRRLLVKESDRSASSGNVVVFDVDDTTVGEGSLVGKVVRKLDGGKGWIEQVSCTAGGEEGKTKRALTR